MCQGDLKGDIADLECEACQVIHSAWVLLVIGRNVLYGVLLHKFASRSSLADAEVDNGAHEGSGIGRGVTTFNDLFQGANAARCAQF